MHAYRRTHMHEHVQTLLILYALDWDKHCVPGTY